MNPCIRTMRKGLTISSALCFWEYKRMIYWGLAVKMFEKTNIPKGLPCAKGGVMPLGVTEGLFQKVTKCKNNPPVSRCGSVTLGI